jgi:hypothetical protein
LVLLVVFFSGPSSVKNASHTVSVIFLVTDAILFHLFLVSLHVSLSQLYPHMYFALFDNEDVVLAFKAFAYDFFKPGKRK